MRVGYIRTSTKEQKLDRQIKEMNDLGIEKIFSEQVSGKDTNREEFQKMLNFVRNGDEIVVSSLDRLGRNYIDIQHTLRNLDDREIILTILDAPFLNFNTGNKTLDRAMKDLFFTILGYIAENEREKILARQRQGIEQAKLKNVYKGKPIKYSENAKNPKDRLIFSNVKNMLENNEPVKQIAENVGIARSTVYEIKKRLEYIL